MVKLGVGTVFLRFVWTDPIHLADSAVVQADTSLHGLLVDGTLMVWPLVTLWWNQEVRPGSWGRMLGTCWA